MGPRTVFRTVAGVLAGWAAVAASCAGPDESPVWSLTKSSYDPYGNAALLSPANDSRVNLLLLLAAQQGKAGPADLGARTFFAWADLRDAIDPPREDESFADPSRCQSDAGGTRDFLAALKASKAAGAEKTALAAARTALGAACGKAEAEARPSPAPEGIVSPAGKGFLRYVQGADAFYRGDWDAASAAFAETAGAPDAWLREAARYMVARTALNHATTAALDEYGWIKEPADRDPALAAAARRGFEAYLKAYPDGRYAASARGLMRRVHWIANDRAALSADYAAALTSPRAQAEPAALHLAEEIDYKLPDAQAQTAAAGPLLLAVADLQRMRAPSEFQDDGSSKPITAAEIAAQAGGFAGNEALYAYVRAAHALYVAKDPKAVLALIPDAARQPAFGALGFSRQMLRGLALEAAHDRNARGFWLELIEGAKAPGQHRAVELALARHDEAAGALDRVFAADSEVTDPIAREILLQYSAGPDLLRRQARGARDQHERQMALWMLLAKELTRGFYADFLRDLTLLPANAGGGGVPPTANAFSNPDELLQQEVPLGTFARPAKGGFACPSLHDTAASLEREPMQPAARLCLGDFLLDNAFDAFEFDTPLGEGLGSSPSRFPGQPVVRQAIYQAIIGDPRAPAETRAYALYRAVNCYAPSGINDCGGTEVAQAQRKAWFQQLKRQYPQSRWARELKYYW